MDPSLLKEREKFKKRAYNAQAVIHNKRKSKDEISNKSAKKPKPTRIKESSSASLFDYRTASGSSQYKFGILAKIVKFMKRRHQEGDIYPLTVQEILEETEQLDIGPRNVHWLGTEALLNNPKIEVIDGDRFQYKPKYKIRSRKELMRLLNKHDQQGLGGILLDDVEEALPNYEKALKILGDQILYVTRPDKKKILFYNDKSYTFQPEEEFQKMWRSITVEGMDEKKMEDYLKRQGITSMQDIGLRKINPVHKKRKGGNKKKGQFKSHNVHMEGILEDYSKPNEKS